MCGIFGIATTESTLSIRHAAFIESALEVGQLRGRDGTGLAVIQANRKVSVEKLAVPGSVFVTTKAFERAAKKIPNSVAVIGHHRKTTHGTNVDENCHPFMFNDIVGVHNGVMYEYQQRELARRFKVADHAVDSHVIFSALNAADKPTEVLSELGMSSYALVWYNKRKHTINIAKNDKRPLAFVVAKDTLYWASEWPMLQWLMINNSLFVKDTYLYRVPDHTHLELSLKSGHITEEKLWTRRTEYKPYTTSLYSRNYDYPYKNTSPQQPVYSTQYATCIDDIIRRGGQKHVIAYEAINETINRASKDDCLWVTIYKEGQITTGGASHFLGSLVVDKKEIPITALTIPLNTDKREGTVKAAAVVRAALNSGAAARVLVPAKLRYIQMLPDGGLLPSFDSPVEARKIKLKNKDKKPVLADALLAGFNKLTTKRLREMWDNIKKDEQEDTVVGTTRQLPLKDADELVPLEGGILITKRRFYEEGLDVCAHCNVSAITPEDVQSGNAIWISQTNQCYCARCTTSQ
jgi:predicted glutamine amidotransferase